MSGIYYRPAIPILAALMIGVWTGNRFPGMWAVGIGGSIIGFSILLFRILKTRHSRIVPFFLFCALGYLSIQPWVSPRCPPDHIIHYRNSAAWTLVGTVANKPIYERNRIRFFLDIQRLSNHESTFAVRGRISVAVYGKQPGIRVGDAITFRSRIRSFRNFNNPGHFDYVRFMTFKNVHGASHTSASRMTILETGRRKGMEQAIEARRNAISSWIDRQAANFPKGTGGVLKALMVGYREDIPAKIRDSFHRAGVSHILAISGLHVGIVAAASMICFTWIFTRIKLLLWHAWTRRAAAIASIIPVVLYGLLAGMSPSTQRATIMVSVFLLSFLIQRDHDAINSLSIAALSILILHPPSLFAISFQLSFLSVFFIVSGFICFKERLVNDPGAGRPWASGCLLWIRSFILASLFAILGTLPVIMVYFHQVSLIGLVTNLIAIPLIGFIVVPLGLFSVLCHTLGIPVADLIIRLSLMVLDPTIGLIQWMSRPPFAAIQTFIPTAYEIVGFYVVFLLFLAGKKGLISGKTVRLAACAVLVAGIIDASYWVHRRYLDENLRATIIDVGQGTAVLLEFPKGETMVVDGGGFSDNATFDVGAKIIAPLLRRRKIGTIDTLVLSHPDSDHLNGLIYLADRFNVETLWTNNEAGSTRGYRRLMEIVKERGIRHPPYTDLPSETQKSSVTLRILYPPRDFNAARRRERWRTKNNNSMVVQLRHGLQSLLLTGDIMKPAEIDMVKRQGENLKSTVLLAPHHGGKGSSTPVFIRLVAPEVVVISSGWRNRFGFPHPSVIERYRARGCRVYNTATHGAITIQSNGNRLTVTSEKRPE